MHMAFLKKSPISSVKISNGDESRFIMAVVQIMYF